MPAAEELVATQSSCHIQSGRTVLQPKTPAKMLAQKSAMRPAVASRARSVSVKVCCIAEN